MNRLQRTSKSKDPHEFFRLAPTKKKQAIAEILSRPDYNIAEYGIVRGILLSAPG